MLHQLAAYALIGLAILGTLDIIAIARIHSRPWQDRFALMGIILLLMIFVTLIVGIVGCGPSVATYPMKG